MYILSEIYSKGWVVPAGEGPQTSGFRLVSVVLQ